MVKGNFSAAAGRFVFVVGALIAGSVWAGDMRVTDAWSRPTPPGIEVGVAYFALENSGKDDRLVSASSPVAERTELHMSKMEGGVMKMMRLDAVEVKQGETILFSPNGRHLMLLGLKRPLKAEDEFPLILKFENAGPVTVQVRVKGFAAKGEGDREMDHSKMKH